MASTVGNLASFVTDLSQQDNNETAHSKFSIDILHCNTIQGLRRHTHLLPDSIRKRAALIFRQSFGMLKQQGFNRLGGAAIFCHK